MQPSNSLIDVKIQTILGVKTCNFLVFFILLHYCSTGVLYTFNFIFVVLSLVGFGRVLKRDEAKIRTQV